MTWTDEQVTAHDELTRAIEHCVEAFHSFDDGAIIAGFVVIVTGASFLKGSELYEDGDDDEGTVSTITCFNKRGQHPLMSMGIVERYREWRRGN